MIGQPLSLSRAWSLLRDPVTSEKRAILADRWKSLDQAVKVPGQGLGQKATGCGATIGIQPKCDFSCTGCYLGEEANRIPPLPLDAVKAQLDALRAYLGPKSNVQITDGEVTLRPEEELVEVLRYARSIGIVPMVMTHGDNLRRRPGLLERLMTHGHLTEISIHVDTTQRGRDGYKGVRSEQELMPLREEFASMIRAARRSTRRRLRAAMTMTITSDNVGEVPEIVRWMIANRDAFSLISFQPLAQVGRTRKSLSGVTASQLWTEIGRATGDAGLTLESTEPLHFGHPDCTRFVPILAIQKKDQKPQLLQLIRDTVDDTKIMHDFFTRGLGGVAFRDDLPLEMAARGAGVLASDPLWMLGEVRRWVNARLRSELGTTFVPLFLGALRKRIRVDSLLLTSHHFMAPEELGTELGQARLAACVFRIPYKNEMVPMCQMNAGGLRDEMYAALSSKA